MQIYKIEDVAKECGLTKRTIRYYEEIGLLFPPERSEGGYRLYTEKHIQRLKQLQNARDVLGFSLQELQEYLSIIEALRVQREGIKETEDKELRREKLESMEGMAGKLLNVIEQKLAKLSGLREETSQLLERIRKARQTTQQGRDSDS